MMKFIAVVATMVVLASCSTREQTAEPQTVQYQVDYGKPSAPLDVQVVFDTMPKTGVPTTLSYSVTPQANGEELEVEVVLPPDLVPRAGKAKDRLEARSGKSQKNSHRFTIPDKKYREIYVVATIRIGTAKMTKVTTLALNPEAKPKEAPAGQPKKNAQGEDILEFPQAPK